MNRAPMSDSPSSTPANEPRVIWKAVLETGPTPMTAQTDFTPADLRALCEKATSGGFTTRVQLWPETLTALLDQRDKLVEALEQSVTLQSHYAELLNMHDGGKRIVFKTADEWIKRLDSLVVRGDGQ